MLGPQQRICGSVNIDSFSDRVSSVTYAGQYDGKVVPLFSQSVSASPMVGACQTSYPEAGS